MIQKPTYTEENSHEEGAASVWNDTPDVLLKLYTLRENPGVFTSLKNDGITLKCVMPMNISPVYQFISEHFAKSFADECMPALIGGDCFVAVRGREIVGFAAVDSTARGFMGPMGVLPKERKKGIATALFITMCKRMREKGYRYGIAGMISASMKSIMEGVCDCIPIPDSRDSYQDMIRGL